MRETGSGAQERVPPLNLICIHLLKEMKKQGWILFNFHALKLDLCSAPSIDPVSSFVCGTALSSTKTQESS